MTAAKDDVAKYGSIIPVKEVEVRPATKPPVVYPAPPTKGRIR
jgi:hypothetical protein